MICWTAIGLMGISKTKQPGLLQLTGNRVGRDPERPKLGLSKPYSMGMSIGFYKTERLERVKKPPQNPNFAPRSS
jgi:hypothetical protein